MDWKEKIIKGMEIIKKACHDAGICHDCPFECYCRREVSEDILPEEWIINENN